MQANTLFSLEGEVALVTGASSGLGARFVKVLAANGAKVVACARRLDRLEALADEVRQAGGDVLPVAMDVTDAVSTKTAFDVAEKHFGTVTVLMNNAGTTHGDRAIEMSDETWRNVMALNLDAVFYVAREAASRMVAAEKSGSIVNTASVLGERVMRGVAAYSVSKAAVLQLTHALALEFGRHDIRVNSIQPGWFKTEINDDYLTGDTEAAMIRQNPMRRLGKEGDLDGVVLLLASKAGSYINGAEIRVDGGHVWGM